MSTLSLGVWFVGSNGNAFADMEGARYCVYPVPGGFGITRNGVEIVGPDLIGVPLGFKLESGAKHYAEWHADMNKVQQ